MGLDIRPEPYDHPAAVDLVAALHTDLAARYGDDDFETDECWAEVTAAQLRPPDGAFFVAWLDERPAGCGAVRAFAVTGASRVGEVKRMYTTPAARGRGIGRLLLAALESEAARLGYGRLVLETGLRQPEAMALYDSAGWARIEPYGRFAEDPLSVCFAKDL